MIRKDKPFNWVEIRIINGGAYIFTDKLKFIKGYEIGTDDVLKTDINPPEDILVKNHLVINVSDDPSETCTILSSGGVIHTNRYLGLGNFIITPSDRKRVIIRGNDVMGYAERYIDNMRLKVE